MEWERELATGREGGTGGGSPAAAAVAVLALRLLTGKFRKPRARARACTGGAMNKTCGCVEG